MSAAYGNAGTSGTFDTPSATLRRREADAATAAWFHELVKEVEEAGDAEVNRARAPLFEKAHRPHVFTAEERRRMDCYESIDYAEGQSLVHRVSTTRQSSTDAKGWLRLLMFVLIGLAVGGWSLLVFQTLDYLAEVKLDAVQGVVRSRNSTYPPFNASRICMSALCNSGHEDGGDDGKAAVVLRTLSWSALLHGGVLYTMWGVLMALLSSLCCLVMPSAAGSGIPDVMAYLNGVMFPRIFNIRNLVVKTLSCILAVSAGLPVGTEGPMIHMGSLIGAGLPTGRSRSLGCSATSVFDLFRNPRDQRDFISAGAACGLTSAFSSPLGGMLFVLEEMATHFSVRLAWLVFLSCLSCMWIIQTCNSFLSGWHLVDRSAMALGDLREASIAMFYIDTVPENTVSLYTYTFIPTVMVAVLSGLLAVAYTVSSIRFSRWRSRCLFPTTLYRVLEPCVFASLFSTACYVLPLFTPCVPTPPHVREKKEALNVELFTAFCAQPETTHHPLATLTMTSPYNLLRLLFSRRSAGLFPAWSLLLHLAIYVVGSSYAGGMFISCGTVIPSLLIGAVEGRLIGVLFQRPVWADEGVVALIGAAAYFAGISRLTFALVVVMMELTADVSHITCLMLGILVAKSIADKCCHSFYHASLEVKAVPFLEAQTSMHLLDTYTARDIMTSPVTVLETMDTVLHVVEALTMTRHNAFPVVRVGKADQAYEGMITRAQLQLLLWVVYLREVGDASEVLVDEEGDDDGEANVGDGAADARSGMASKQVDAEGFLQSHVTAAELKRVHEFLFWNRLPSVPMMEHLPLSAIRSYIDLRPYVDNSAPYVQQGVCVSRAYYTFRHLGLRHLPVLDRTQRVVGILTRVSFVGDRLMEKVGTQPAEGFVDTDWRG
ncbi:chloride channel protein, putative [Leishmania donovani]|uniref:Chloride channel protein n=1 Tax=Leishmania donovani TaxID=5661 RepID=E9BPA7_LEIDO|nr:chloride channel protein, putative [Leishmania donovani]AYU81907.1 chloride channel protein, putative [Leishmania donovani]CBZ37085.1 chloride channel protein, putative [Leishmania donovani]